MTALYVACIVAGSAAAVYLLAWVIPDTARGIRRMVQSKRRPETGAVPGWSPKQDQADSETELTPTGLLEHLADGRPSWAALTTDLHRALNPAWDAMLAEFGGAIDESAAEFDARMDEIEADFHRRRDNMTLIEADHARRMAELDDERDRLMVGAA